MNGFCGAVCVGLLTGNKEMGSSLSSFFSLGGLAVVAWMKFGFVTKSETSVVGAAVSGTLKERGVVAALNRLLVGGLKNEGSFGWGGGPKLNLSFNLLGIFGWGGGPRLNLGVGFLCNDCGISG